MERDLFLRKYRIEQEDFDAAGVSWEELTAIADHYATIGEAAGDWQGFCRGICMILKSGDPFLPITVPAAPGHLLEDHHVRKSSRRNLPSWELIILEIRMDLIGIVYSSCTVRIGVIP